MGTENDSARAAPDVAWAWSRFEGLSADDVYDALQLRGVVFVVEQNAAYLDADGADRHGWHLLGRLAAPWGDLPTGQLVAYLRWVDAGVKYAEPSLGRVVNHPELRGLSMGRTLVAEGLKRGDLCAPADANRISAQAHLANFYREFGYQSLGELYLEDGIPHIEMLRPAAAEET
jgi:ElaA protein